MRVGSLFQDWTRTRNSDLRQRLDLASINLAPQERPRAHLAGRGSYRSGLSCFAASPRRFRGYKAKPGAAIAAQRLQASWQVASGQTSTEQPGRSWDEFPGGRVKARLALRRLPAMIPCPGRPMRQLLFELFAQRQIYCRAIHFVATIPLSFRYVGYDKDILHRPSCQASRAVAS